MEAKEEEKEGEDDEDVKSPEQVRASAGVLPPVLVGTSPDGHDAVEDELDNLSLRHPGLPGRRVAKRGGGKVGVHRDVDEEVGNDDDPLHTDFGTEVDVGEEDGDEVVVAVQEDDVLALDDQEDCVHELVVLGQVEEVVPPDDAALRRRVLGIAEHHFCARRQPLVSEIQSEDHKQVEREQREKHVVEEDRPLEDLRAEASRKGLEVVGRKNLFSKKTQDDVAN